MTDSDTRRLAEFFYQETGGAGPRWQMHLNVFHALALYDDRKRTQRAEIAEQLTDLGELYGRVGPRHSLFRAAARVARAEASLKRAQTTFDGELGLWVQFRRQGIGASSLPLAS